MYSMSIVQRTLIIPSTGIYHDPKNPHGENLASNWGTGEWANKPSTDSVLTRLVEKEEGLGYPQNGHFTQVRHEGVDIIVLSSLGSC